MGTLLVVILFVGIIVTIIYGILRSLQRVWLHHRLKMALLQKLEATPHLLESPEAVEALLGTLTTDAAPRRDLAIAGASLAVIGLACLVLGKAMAVGRLAVGLYLGGWICVPLGLFMGLAGWVVGRLTGRQGVLAGEKRHDA